MIIGKTTALTRQTFVGKVMSLLLNMLSRLVITFLSRSKCLLISWLQSPSAVILEPPKIKSYTVSTVSWSICHEVMGPDVMIFVFWMLSFKPTFPLSSFTFVKTLFSSSSLTTLKPLTVWITTNWKIFKKMRIADHLTCLLRNLYAGQEATVRTRHGTADWFQIGKGVHKGCILSPCLFNLHAEYIMQNAGMDESQAGIKIAGKISTPDMQLMPL